MSGQKSKAKFALLVRFVPVMTGPRFDSYGFSGVGRWIEAKGVVCMSYVYTCALGKMSFNMGSPGTLSLR